MNGINSNNKNNKKQPDQIFFLSEIIGTKVIINGKKIGKLSDLIIVDKDKVAEVTNLYIARPFGNPPLLVPWEKVKSMIIKEIIIEIENFKEYERVPEEGSVFLKDHILDKRVLDVEDREVEVVYDVKMVLRNNKLYVSDVDLSRYGLLRRIGLKWLANFIYKLADNIRDQTTSWDYIQPLPEKISGFKGDIKLKVLKEKLAEMPPIDLADILEELDPDLRIAVFDELETERASDTLEELEPKVQRDMIASLQKDKVAQLINDMSPVQAADVLSILPWSERKIILKLLNEENVSKIKAILQREEEKIANFIVSDYLRFKPNVTVLQARKMYQKVARGKDVIMYLYIVDELDKLHGVIDIKELLRANDDALLNDIMVSNIISLNPDSTLREASLLFERYGFRAIPVTDENDKMFGVVSYRDVMSLKHLYL